MEKYEKRIQKNKKRRRRNIMLTSISLLILFSFGFFVGGKISHRKNVVVSAANTSTKSNVNGKDEQKKTDDESMNKRESKINENNTKDAGEFDPYKADGKKIVYLTFDDGPSTNNTPRILDILKKSDVKATFFIIGQNAEQNKELIKREISEGHVVANHTYSHDMHHIYSNPKVFISDLDKCSNLLKTIIGKDYNSKLIRFPGGSFGQRLAPFREEAKKAGYHHVDWNDLTGDAERPSVPVSNLISKVKMYGNQDHLVILMHDAPAKITTVQALPEIIDYFKSKGYVFETLK